MRASSYPLLPVEEVERTVLEHTPVLPAEEVHIGDAVGRALAEDIIAPRELPRWPVSAVDGYAVRAQDGGGRLRVLGEAAAGRPVGAALQPGTAVRILTGAVLPEGADSVVMVEEVEQGPDWVDVPKDPVAGRNFHAPGSDIAAAELVLVKGVELGAAELGLIASLGIARVRVGRRPMVALLSTGDELVEVGDEPGPGQIPDSNRHALRAALLEAGAAVTSLGIAPDTPEALRRLVEVALLGAEALVTSGGVSVGTHDLVKPLLESLGEVHCGRVKLRPGKPFTFATLPGSKVAFGLPGFPVSSLVTFEVFVRPALRRMQGYRQLRRPELTVTLGYDARAAGDRTEYQRVSLEQSGGEWIATATGSQSSSRLLSLARAHALVRIAPGDEGLQAGTKVPAILLSLPSIT